MKIYKTIKYKIDTKMSKLILNLIEYEEVIKGV